VRFMSSSPLRSVTCAVPLLVVLLSAATAQQVCVCAGEILPPPYSGGDGTPLLWKYAPYIQSMGTGKEEKVICYLKAVSNQDASDVRLVRWEVANFFRRIIPSKQTRSAGVCGLANHIETGLPMTTNSSF
jgi:hypothetical protein